MNYEYDPPPPPPIVELPTALREEESSPNCKY